MVLKKESPSWINYIQGRIKKNKNFLGFISGPTGSGKSYAGLTICQLLDEGFTAQRVVFSGRELMNLVNSDELTKGSAILFDEAGIDLSNRTWQSLTNRLLNFLLQTFRHKNFILLFTSPYLDFVDASTRKLFHAEFSTVNIDFTNKKVKLKPQLIQYNGRIKKFYYKFLRVITPKGVVPIRSWSLEKPSKDLLKEYEDKKNKFTSQLNKSIEEDLNKLEGVKPSPLTEQQQKVLEYIKEGLLVDKISEKLNIHRAIVYNQINYIKKKGYKIKPIKEGGRIIKYEAIKN